jgi:UDP-N-acetylglucosamine--N-acetylmuramyl-(pentapeptide) pyrophosphoryl-undecaprenol N-acetylglucosamine transferase
MSRAIMIMAGGTGGHIFPGLAVADVLRNRGWQVTWLGAPDSMESRLVPRHGYALAEVKFSGLRGKGLLRKLLLPFSLALAFWQSAAALLRYRPDVVLGMGGYIAFPGGMMAAFLRRPLVIHEQNSISGLSNRVLANFSNRVLTGFPGTLKNAIWCGNPVRSDIARLDPPQQRYAARSGKLNLLVVGGSLGAKALNETVPHALAMLSEEVRPRVLHQTGSLHHEAVSALYGKLGVKADVRPFIDDMAGAYADADMVICRSGALTVAELAASGVASLLVPYPFAVDDHQTHNAKYLSDAGAAILMPQSELDAAKLSQLLGDLSREKLAGMADKARSLAKVNAAESVAGICEELAA